MERVYKSEGILFKILPCLLIAMYAVMCLFGSYVCATNDECYFENNVFYFKPYDFSYDLTDFIGNYYISFVYNKDPNDSSKNIYNIVISTTPNIYFDFSDYYVKCITKDGFFTYISGNFSTADNLGIVFNNLKEKLVKLNEHPEYLQLTSNSVGSAYDGFYYAGNTTIRDFSTDEVVFQGAPLRQGIVTAETVEQIQPTVQETIVKILPIAIAVLALLIALRILPKVLLKFH